ncbi:MAG: hypothetical protein IJR14_04150, partial [Synergistaceae bacterium]|nr:hypothetical protein [Synergistaceae bacterium]
MATTKEKARSTDRRLLAELMAKARQVRGKRTAKATVFTDLFGDPERQLQLVRALHPELDVGLGDIILLTLSNVLLDTPYKDLGLLVGDRLL